MFKVLIALDGSPLSEQALGFACELLAGKPVELTVLHVMPRHLIYGRGGPVVAEVYDPEEERAHSVELLANAERRLRGDGFTEVRLELEVGDPADLILAVAVKKEIDLIVLGSRDLNAMGRFLLGSVSTKITTHAHCAVLVAHPKTSPAHHPARQPEAVLPV